ncbi:MAG: DNA translocase SpoIIIE [bacterium ADurb.Bin243]|nr:MAG: DNA translocase SpoIIIE [bacterium ADurb.Bin243]
MPSAADKTDRKTRKNQPVDHTAAYSETEMKKRAELTGLLLMFASVTLLVFFIIKPSESKWLGAAYGLLYWFKLQFGVTMYFVSFLLWFFGIQKFMHGSITGRGVEYLGYFALLLFSNLFFEILNSSGGLFGSFIASKTILLLGNAGALLLSVFGTLIGASAAFNILLAPLFVAFLTGSANAAFAVLKFVVFSTAFVITFVFKAFSACVHYSFDYVKSIFSNGGDEETPANDEFDGRAERVEMFRKDPELEKPLSDNASQEITLEEKLFSNFKKGDEDYIVRNAESESQSGGIKLDGYNVERLENIARLQNIDKKSPEAEPALREEDEEESCGAASGLESLSGSASAAQLNLNEVPITRAYDAPRGAGTPSADEETLLKNYYSKNSGGKFGSANREKSVRPDSYDEYDYPDFNAILKPVEKIEGISEDELKYNAEKLVTTLKNFNVEVKIAHITCGPTVTRYELQPASGVKVSKVVGLADDLALALATSSLRMEAPIPGKAAIGVEVPNTKPVPVFFSELITLPEFNESKSPLLFALGKTITGQPIIADLRNMPHLLVAGTTGSGKSVCINTIIASILFHARPDEVRFVMVDPKMVELTGYNDIPHLIHPVVVKVKDVPFLLEWGVYEMERRYRLLSAFGVRAIDGFNAMVEEYNAGKYELNEKESEILVELGIEDLEKLPFLVFVIDELADIMMTDKSNKVEEYICRLAQMARAVGMHLIVATQRPSVNVITGLIKANLPSRIAFAVSSVTDSRTILDCKGAEKLIGRGDMLYLPTGLQKPVRVQGAYVRDDEIKKLTDFLRANYDPDYKQDVEDKINEYQRAKDGDDSSAGSDDYGQAEAADELFYDAARLVVENKMGSASMLQRILKIGHNRALKLMDRMEKIGVVGPFEDKKPRKVLWSIKDLEDNIKKVA